MVGATPSKGDSSSCANGARGGPSAACGGWLLGPLPLASALAPMLKPILSAATAAWSVGGNAQEGVVEAAALSARRKPFGRLGPGLRV